jgi:hypothetical protein
MRVDGYSAVGYSAVGYSAIGHSTVTCFAVGRSAIDPRGRRGVPEIEEAAAPGVDISYARIVGKGVERMSGDGAGN